MMAAATISGLAERARSVLAPWFHERHFPSGNLLWREGETSGWLVAIRSGHVKVYRLLPTGRAVTLFVFGPGDVFGFLPFLDGEPYPAYAQAIDDVSADVMPRAELLEAVRLDPNVAMTLISLLGRRLAKRRKITISPPNEERPSCTRMRNE